VPSSICQARPKTRFCMSMSTAGVVVAPHPLITHWLTCCAMKPPHRPLFASAHGPNGRWLTYEAAQGLVAHRPVTVRLPWPAARNRAWMEHPLLRVYRSCGRFWASGKEPRQCSQRRVAQWVWFCAMRSARHRRATSTH